MGHCVNRSLPEFKALQAETGLNSLLLAAKISVWQESNGLDKFPSVNEILFRYEGTNSNNIPIVNSVNEVVEIDIAHIIRLLNFSPEKFEAITKVKKELKEYEQKLKDAVNLDKLQESEYFRYLQNPSKYIKDKIPFIELGTVKGFNAVDIFLDYVLPQLEKLKPNQSVFITATDYEQRP